MKKTLLVLLAPLAMMSAYAQTPATRADVKAETAAAGKAGELNKNTEGTNAPAAVKGKERAEVKAEAKAAVEAKSKNAEGTDAPKAVKGKTRAEVKAEAGAKGSKPNDNTEVPVVPAPVKK